MVTEVVVLAAPSVAALVLARVTLAERVVWEGGDGEVGPVEAAPNTHVGVGALTLVVSQARPHPFPAGMGRSAPPLTAVVLGVPPWSGKLDYIMCYVIFNQKYNKRAKNLGPNQTASSLWTTVPHPRSPDNLFTKSCYRDQGPQTGTSLAEFLYFSGGLCPGGQETPIW